MRRMPLLLVLLLCFSPCCFAAESPGITFCETFDDQWKPKNQGTEFHGTTVSWIATAEKPYGIPQITVSIYRHDGAKESLVERKTLEVSPEWDTTGIRYMPLPSEGEYTIALTTPDGTTLNKGKMKLVKAENAAAPPREETLGARLEALFNKYSPKKEK